MKSTTSLLRAFLERQDRPNDALGYLEAHGFLFAVACAPEIVLPSEWTPIVLGEQGPNFDTLEQAQGILGELTQIYNEINAGVTDGSVQPPRQCDFRDDVLSNFDDDAPVAQWARGFLCGHQWLDEVWDELVPEKLKDDLASASLVLCFFASKQLAEACTNEAMAPGHSLEDVAKTMHELLPGAMHEYANLGRSIHEVLAEIDDEVDAVETVTKVGRNEPCPCESGKTFKRCHGRRASAD